MMETTFQLASEIPPRSVEWLWPLRVPLGELSVIDGDPGTNKSSLVLDLAAKVSSGHELLGGTAAEPGGVLILAAEDSHTKTLRPRLEAAGADLSRIAVANNGVAIPADLAKIKTVARRIGAKLIVIDPMMAFLKTNASGDQPVRQALLPIAEFAENTNAAVVFVRHLNKSGRRHSIYRGSGSIGIIATMRSALLVGKHPDESNLRVVCQTKSNLGPFAPSLVFEPVPNEDGIVRIEWRGECNLTAEDLLDPPKGNKLEEAKDFLDALLFDGPVEQKVVKAEAIEVGLAWRTVERAKEVLGVVSTREGWGPGSTCFWELP